METNPIPHEDSRQDATAFQVYLGFLGVSNSDYFFECTGPFYGRCCAWIRLDSRSSSKSEILSLGLFLSRDV
jgi:hypothetical protein